MLQFRGMAKNASLFSIGYFLVIVVLLWALSFFPECSIYVTYHLAACTLLSCMIRHYTWPYVKRIFFSEKVSSANKAVLITGCDSGFGHNLAKRLDSEGFRVFASCLFPSGDGAKALQKTCSNSLEILGLDVTKDESIKEALCYVEQHLNGSKLWAIVNNAGMIKGFDIEWTRIEDFQEVMDINAMGVVRVTKAFLPLVRRSKGRVVTITSILARNSVQTLSAYCMSKFAASCFCECLRQEMHPWGVKVITIEPDFFRTSFAIWEVMESRMDALIENFDEESKEEYGEYYFEAYKKFLKRIMLHSSSHIHKVVDCLEDAVMLQEPCYVYRPRGNIFFRLIFGIQESLPKPIADILSRYVTHMLGVPKPKKAEQIF